MADLSKIKTDWKVGDKFSVNFNTDRGSFGIGAEHGTIMTIKQINKVDLFNKHCNLDVEYEYRGKPLKYRWNFYFEMMDEIVEKTNTYVKEQKTAYISNRPTLYELSELQLKNQLQRQIDGAQET